MKLEELQEKLPTIIPEAITEFGVSRVVGPTGVDILTDKTFFPDNKWAEGNTVELSVIKAMLAIILRQVKRDYGSKYKRILIQLGYDSTRRATTAEVIVLVPNYGKQIVRG